MTVQIYEYSTDLINAKHQLYRALQGAGFRVKTFSTHESDFGSLMKLTVDVGSPDHSRLVHVSIYLKDFVSAGNVLSVIKGYLNK